MKHQGFLRIPWKSLENLGFQFKDEGSVSRNTTDKSRVELLKYPSIFQGHSLKILELQGKDRAMISREIIVKSRVEQSKYPRIFQGQLSKILKLQVKDGDYIFKECDWQVKGWRVKRIKDFSRLNLENPQTSSQGWGLHFQGLWLTSQGLKTKKD